MSLLLLEDASGLMCSLDLIEFVFGLVLRAGKVEVRAEPHLELARAT